MHKKIAKCDENWSRNILIIKSKEFAKIFNILNYIETNYDLFLDSYLYHDPYCHYL